VRGSLARAPQLARSAIALRPPREIRSCDPGVVQRGLRWTTRAPDTSASTRTICPTREHRSRLLRASLYERAISRAYFRALSPRAGSDLSRLLRARSLRAGGDLSLFAPITGARRAPPRSTACTFFMLSTRKPSRGEEAGRRLRGSSIAGRGGSRTGLAELFPPGGRPRSPSERAAEHERATRADDALPLRRAPISSYRRGMVRKISS
jgi:hypothetical protein